MITITALLLSAPLMLTDAPQERCDFRRNGTHRSISGTHIDSDKEGGTSLISVVHSENGRCRSATIVGKLRYSEAEDDIVEIPFGGHASFSEHSPGEDRELIVQRGSDGGVVHLYRRNGNSAIYDGDAKRWLAQFLPNILMESGINVGPRVARWRSQGGVDNVLTQIATMESSGAKRSHYAELLTVGNLGDRDLDNVVRHAGRNLPSSGDLRAILIAAAPRRGGGVRSGPALEDAVSRIASSGDKTAVLRIYGQTSDREMLLSVMRMAREIQSSGDKSGLLRTLASRYLGSADRELSSAFFQTAVTVPSSGDLRNVLDSAIPYAAKSPDESLLLIDAARRIASSGDRSEVLISLVYSGALKTPKVRDAFFDVAATVPSSGDRSRVLEAAARAQ